MCARIGSLLKGFSVALYIRLSREDEEDKESESVQNQKEFLTKYCSENGFSISEIYVDDGYTGTNFERPSFKEMISDIESGKINMVITKDLSRLGRDYIETGRFIEKYFPEHDVRFIAVNDGIDTFSNSISNDMTPFRAVMNDMYSKDISNKVKSVLNTKRKNGKFIGSFAPYGYEKSPEDKNRLIIDQEAANVVRRIFELYKSGFSYSKIAGMLNQDGIKAPVEYKKIKYKNYKHKKSKVSLWNQEMVKLILTNPTYTGCLTQNKCRKISYKLKKLKRIERSNWITVENTHEPIVDRETFDFVQELVKSKATLEVPGFHKDHLLKGLIFCGDCGETMTFSKSYSNYQYCICSKYKRFKACTRHSILEGKLEEIVLNELRKLSTYFQNKDKHLQILHENIGNTHDNNRLDEIKRIEHRLSEIKTTIKRLYDNLEKGVLNDEDFVDLSKEYHKEREEIKKRLKILQDEKEENLNKSNREEELKKFVRDFENLELIGRLDLVKLINRIEVYEDSIVKIKYKFKI